MKLNDNIKPALAICIMILGFAYFFITTFTGTEPNDQILIAIVGLMTLSGNYYFGNSSGSAKKDETISDLSKKTPSN